MVPGDEGKVNVYRRRKNYYEAQLLELWKPSKHRIEPRCSHFGICGGCKWQHLEYPKLLELKQKHVDDAFRKIAHIELEQSAILAAPEPYEYRNKLEYTFSNKRWITQEEANSGAAIEESNAVGFHVPARFDKVIDVETCHLQIDISNDIRNTLRAFCLENDLSFYDIRENVGMMRNLIVRTSSLGELMVIVAFGEKNDNIPFLMNFLKEQFPEITSLNYVVNLKLNDSISDLEVVCFSGEAFIWEKMGDLRFKIRPKSFFQTNQKQALALYSLAIEFAQLKSDDVLYDLYSGTGTIGLSCAKQVQEVVGVEYVEDAVSDAKENAETNDISNSSFFAGDLKDLLNEEFVAKNGKPNVIICDPPRAGMHKDVVDQILKMGAERVVYVSCNPSTQARDVELMLGDYEIKRSQAVDMFPQTAHVENVILLEKREV